MKTRSCAAALLMFGFAAAIASGCGSEAAGEVGAPGSEPNAPKTPNAPPAVPATPPDHCKGDFPYPDITAAIGGQSVVGSTVGEPNTLDAPCGAESSGDVAFVVRPTKTGVITATTLNPGTDYDSVLSVRSLCDDPTQVIACNDDSGGTLASTVSWNAVSGAAYLVVVSGFAFHEGSFELTLTQPVSKPGAQPATPSDPATPGGPNGPAVPPVFCAHSPCVEGAPLKDGCSPCAANVCSLAPHCCDVVWDEFCALVATFVCGSECPAPPPPPTDCGDGFCSWTPGDDCFTCPADCGECPPPPPADCGDGFCSWMPGDDCFTCPADCGPCPPPEVCGDGFCSGFPGDDCFSCPLDCGECPPPPVCGDGTCDLGGGEWCGGCPADCGECPPPPVCADGVCAIEESCFNCPVDCDCTEPAVCGDLTCTQGENCTNCAGDCGACAACSHDECTAGAALGYTCSPCVTSLCDIDAYCCNAQGGSWDSICVLEAGAVCGLACGL